LEDSLVLFLRIKNFK